MKIFSGSSNKPLAEKIAEKLHTKLSPVEIHIFPDGERRVRVEDKVVNQDAVIVQSTSTPTDQNYIELFFLADAVVRSGGKHVTAVIPYLGYQRQDHVFRDGESVSLQVVVKTMEVVGIDRFVVFDLHSIKIPEFFRIPVKHLSALPLFAETIKKEGWNNTNSILISPDMGGIRRIKILSDMLDNMPYAAIEKNRDLQTGNVEASNIESFTGELQLRDKRAIIVDDMISSGSTIATAANLLLEEGVKEMSVFATHPVFSSEAPKVLQNSAVKQVFVTDTVYVPEDKYFSKLHILTVAGMIAKEIKGEMV